MPSLPGELSVNIYKKVFLSIFLLFSIFAFILIYVSQGLVLSNFQKLEEKSAEENLIRLKGVLDSETAYMGRINLDWAAWNETYEFIETPSPSYLDSNLPEGTLQDLNLNLILFANETGHVIRAKLEDSEGGEELPLPEELFQMLKAGVFRVQAPGDKIEGLILLEEKPMLISAYPITSSNWKGPVRGTLIMGRYVDRNFVENIEKRVGLPVEIQAINGKMPADFLEAYVNAEKNAESWTYVKPLSAEKLAGYGVIYDILGKPVVILKAEMERSLHAQGLKLRELIILFLLSACILALEGSKILMEKIFFSRFLEIESFVKETRREKDLSKRLLPKGKDEMTSLSKGINAMMNSLQEAEQEIRKRDREKQEILNSLSELLIFLSPDLKIKWANKEALEYMNEDLKSLAGKSRKEIREQAGKSAAFLVDSLAEEALSNGVNISGEARSPDGRTWLVKANPVCNDKGQIIGILKNFIDITARKNYEEHVLRAKMAAEAANQTKSAFLANMSHELRTPLNSIIGFSDLLVEQGLGPLDEKQLRYANNISKSGRHLLRLINDILDLSKLEAGKTELQYSEFGLEGILQEVKETLAPLATGKNIRLEIELEPGLKTLRADRNKFIQILYNLISNAIKFTPEQGLILVKASLLGSMVKISVKDNGIGISGANQKILFSPFMQVDSSRSREYGGTGLGLTLVKEMVALHGGEIRLQSKEGCGSTFSFTLPLKGKECEAREENLD